jgi:hypothetical protein
MSGIQPAQMLYAAAAAQFNPQNQAPHWLFLKFPSVFGGAPFQQASMTSFDSSSSHSPQRATFGPSSEDSTGQRGSFPPAFYYQAAILSCELIACERAWFS